MEIKGRRIQAEMIISKRRSRGHLFWAEMLGSLRAKFDHGNLARDKCGACADFAVPRADLDA